MTSNGDEGDSSHLCKSLKMITNGDEGDSSGEIQSDPVPPKNPNPKPPRPPRPPRLKEYRIRIPSMKSRFMDEQAFNPTNPRRERLLDFLKPRPSIEWLRNFRFFSSPFAVFRRKIHERDEFSLSVPSPVGIRRRFFHINFIRRIDWSSLSTMCLDWLSHPMNAALLLWLVCVAASATMLGLLVLGLLDSVFPTTAFRNHWIEISNQTLNALFTLMSLYQHPILFHQIFMLCRWRSEDVVALRKTYCKNGGYRPHEWRHMLVVILLLHITCLSQYVVCSLYWGYSSKSRPEFWENFFFALGTGAPVLAAVYTVYSPLGREYDSDSDEESQSEGPVDDVKRANRLGLKLSSRRRVLVSRPEWVGGLFDCREDVTVGALSFFCTCCVFGWNMERLGFGNMYVHIVTFLLLCLAPFWIFNNTALRIHDYVIGDAMGFAGVLLCACGLIYGGFWRIQMRKRFNLPGNELFCGSASMTDYFQWFFCWSCALAQEVRTGNFYDVEDDSLYRRMMDSGHLEAQGFLSPIMTPISHRGGSNPPMNLDECFSPLPVYSLIGSPVAIFRQKDYWISPVEEGSSGAASDDAMSPPVRPLMDSEDRVGGGCVVLPTTKLEDIVMDVDTEAGPSTSPSLQTGGLGDGDAIAALSSSSLIETGDKITGSNIVTPSIGVEDNDGDMITSTLIQAEDRSSTST